MSKAPLNPEFVEWRNNNTRSELYYDIQGEEHSLGLIPEPFDWSHLREQKVRGAAILELPTSFDLRDSGQVTSVKDQGICGSCWTFATCASLESNILKNQSETWDFSEQNLKNTHGFDWGHCYGGNSSMSTAYLSRWDGPVNEADDPYDTTNSTSSGGLTVQKYVKSVLKFSTQDDIKNALMNYGALYTKMRWENAYYTSSDTTYYYNGSDSTNHAVTLVGWDDSKATAASSDGAWLIKNSWGASWGNSGYFWISYYDTKAVKIADAFCNTVLTSTYTTNYQYDPLGQTSALGYGVDYAWGANVFTATSNDSLSAVGFHALAANTSYEIAVYDSIDTSNGRFYDQLGTTTSGSVTNAGYHTISLNPKAALQDGNNFGIVVKFTTPGYTFPIPIEDSIANYSSAASADSGESYISSNGVTFSDLNGSNSNANVCIKGLTVLTVNRPPELGSIGNKSIDENQLLSFSVSATDPDGGDVLTLTTSALPTGASFTDNGNGTGDFSWTPTYEQSGSPSVTFTVTDDGTPNESDEETIQITVNNVNRAPVLAAIGNKSTNENQLLSFSVSASDDDNDGLTLTTNTLPTGASFTDNGNGTGDFSWTPTYEQSGSPSVTFTVTDDGTPNESDEETIQITVNNVNRAPVLAAIGNKSTNENQLLSFSVSASDDDNDGLTITTNTLPTGASFTDNGNGTGDFSWTPAYTQSGDYSVTFTVTDDGTPNESDEETIDISVTNVLYSVDISASSNGSVNPSGNQNVDPAYTLLVTATPLTGYHFTSWDVSGGVTITDGDETGEFSITGNGTIQAHFAINDYTVTVSSNGNGTVTPSGNQPVAHNEVLSVTASADAGYHFDSWTVTGGVSITDGDETGEFTIAGNGTITANFAINQYTVTFVPGSNGNISGTLTQVVNHGSNCTEVTAVPNENYHFTGWTGGYTGIENPLTITNVTSDVTIDANFTIDQYTVTFNSGVNGDVNGQSQVVQTVDHGSNCTAVTANPSAGYHLGGWTGDYNGTQNPLTITDVTADMTITANFAINTYSVTVSSSGNGIVTPSGEQNVDHNDILSVTASPNTNYQFSEWNMAGGVTIVDGDESGLFRITGEGTITAVFRLATSVINNGNDSKITSECLSASPNPVPSNEKLYFFFQGKFKSDAELMIYDQIGNLVFKKSYPQIGGDVNKPKKFGQWSVTNRNSRAVSSGTYLAVLTVSGDYGKKERFIIRVGVKE